MVHQDLSSLLEQGLKGLRSGQHEEAIASYKEAIRLKPDDAEAHYNLGSAYGNLGRYEEAVMAFKVAILLKPELVGAHYNLGLAYLKISTREGAVKEYNILKDLHGDTANELLGLINEG